MEWAVVDGARAGLLYTLLTFRLQPDPETRLVVGLCEELDISSFGETVSEALDNVLEATLLYLNTIEELGERGRVFAERGVDVHEPGTSKRPVRSMGDAVRQVVPAPNDIVTTRLVGLPAAG